MLGNSYLIPMLIAFAFIFLPTKQDTRGLIQYLAYSGWPPPAQWSVAICLSFLPVVVMALPLWSWVQSGRRRKLWPVAALLLLTGYCAVRVLWWVTPS